MGHVDGDAGPLAEFGTVRQEIEGCLQRQQQILTLQLTVVGAIFGIAAQKTNLAGLLLIVPFVSYLLCGRLCEQHHCITRAATYIQLDLSPRVPGGLHWEPWTRRYPRPDHLLGWIVPLLLTFPGASVMASCWTSTYVLDRFGTGHSLTAAIGLAAVWVLGIGASALSGYLILQMPKASPPPSDAAAVPQTMPCCANNPVPPQPRRPATTRPRIPSPRVYTRALSMPRAAALTVARVTSSSTS